MCSAPVSTWKYGAARFLTFSTRLHKFFCCVPSNAPTVVPTASPTTNSSTNPTSSPTKQTAEPTATRPTTSITKK